MSHTDSMKRTIPLCAFSTAAGGGYSDELGCWAGDYYEKLEECPLGLNRAEGQKFPCKVRQGADTTVKSKYERRVTVRVLTCAFPNTWNGTPIRSPAAFVAHLRRKGDLK